MKVFRFVLALGRNYKVLLYAVYPPRRDSVSQLSPPNLLLHRSPAWDGSGLDYNQLKIRVLALFKGSEELASDDVRALLRDSKIELTDKAVKMALMRYTRQGILARSKKFGLFQYRLTEKGVARRAWLTRTK